MIDKEDDVYNYDEKVTRTKEPLRKSSLVSSIFSEGTSVAASSQNENGEQSHESIDRRTVKFISIDEQLKAIREQYRYEFMNGSTPKRLPKSSNRDTNEPLIERGLGKRSEIQEQYIPSTDSLVEPVLEQSTENIVPWKKGTILITGDSMLYGLDEKKLRNSKVRIHPGASIENMYLHLAAHLEKKPSKVVLLVGTNNCVNERSSIVIEKLLKLKLFILSRCCCEVYFSTLINRTDMYSAQQVVKEVNIELGNLDINLINNNNIDASCLGRKGLHLSDRGTGKLIMNFVNFVKKLNSC